MQKQLKIFNHKFDVFTRTLPDPIRPASNEILGWSKAAMTLLLRRELFLYQLPIDNDPEKGSIGYLGPGTNLRFLAYQVGAPLSDVQAEWQTPWWQARKAIHQAQKNNDGVVVELPQRVLHRLNLDGGIFTLPQLRWRIKTDCAWEEIEGRFHTDARRDIRKSDEINCITSNKEKDLLYFYHNIYYPYITQNFGEMAQPTSLEELRYYFQRGWLVLAKNTEDQVVGGSMCFVIDNVMYDYVGATITGLDRRTQRGITANYFIRMMRLAHEQGCSDLDLGLARPLLDDGVARYKRKWGAYVLADFAQNWGIWISTGRDPDKTAYFLAQHPWIWLDDSGYLRGFIVENNTDAPLNVAQVKKIGKRFWTPGLHSIVLCATGGFEADTPLVDNPIPKLGSATEWRPDGY